MKKVYPSKQVCHVWANQQQQEGRNSTGNVFFERDTIYSYGHHFPMARIDAKNKVVLFTTKTYSITTSKHLSFAWRAIPGTLKILCVNNVMAKTMTDHGNNLDIIRKEAEGLVLSFYRARTAGESIKNKIDTLVDTYNTYSALYCKRAKLSIKLDNETGKKVLARAKAAAALKAQETRAENEKYINAIPIYIDSWRKFEEDHNQAVFGCNPYKLRDMALKNTLLRTNEDTIYTSKGAEFPVSHAKLAWRIIKDCHDNNKEFIPNGHTIHVGPFTISKIETNGDVTAGCHFIKYAEIELMAKTLGLV